MRLLLLPLLLGACGLLPGRATFWADGPLWDPRDVVPTDDGIYVPLPEAGQVALVRADGSWDGLDLGDGRVVHVSAAPDGHTIVAIQDRFRCDADRRDVRNPVVVGDCPSDLVRARDLLVVRDGALASRIPIQAHLNAVAWSHDAGTAIAYVDHTKPLDLEGAGVVNLTSVLVVDIDAGEAAPVTVGFAPDRVLFTASDAEAVVLSQNAVAVVDLAADPPISRVSFPLTLDAAHAVVPLGVDLTADGRHAIVSVRASSDLYLLDLDARSVNIVALSGSPAAMATLEAVGRTVFTHANRAVVDILDHDRFEVLTLDLEEAMTGILAADRFVVLYNRTPSVRDVYRIDFSAAGGAAPERLVRYRLQNAVDSAFLAPTGEFAVALTRPSQGAASDPASTYARHPGMEILDLRDDRGRVTPYLLEETGVGVAFDATDSALHALVLQRRVDYLYELDLLTGRAREISLTAPPAAIRAVPGTGFLVAHDVPTGLLTFYDPADDSRVEVAGFATHGLLEDVRLIREER